LTLPDERSRVLGGVVCLAALGAAALFLYGIAVKSYWALALPLAAGVLFVLGLVFWIGWTILTVQVGAEGSPLGESLADATPSPPASGEPEAATPEAAPPKA
jgi:hypothetical protein